LKEAKTVMRPRWIINSTSDARMKMIEIANLVSTNAVDTNHNPNRNNAFLTSYSKSIRQTQA